LKQQLRIFMDMYDIGLTHHYSKTHTKFPINPITIRG